MPAVLPLRHGGSAVHSCQSTWRRSAMAAKFDLKRGGNEQYMFNLKAANGEVILTSELYNEKPGAVHGIESVKVPPWKTAASGESGQKTASRFVCSRLPTGKSSAKAKCTHRVGQWSGASGRSSGMLRLPAWMINRPSIFATTAGSVGGCWAR